MSENPFIVSPQFIGQRIEYPTNAYRLAVYPDGRPSLQQAYRWAEMGNGGICWKDVPTVSVDDNGEALPNQSP